MPVPGVLDWVHAGGVPETFTTAHDALFTQARLRAGERLLVTARRAASARPACSSAGPPGRASPPRSATTTHARAVAELGAEQVLDPEGFEEHGPFDVVLELVGAPNIAGEPQGAGDDGRVVVIGVGGGVKAEVDLRR